MFPSLPQSSCNIRRRARFTPTTLPCPCPSLVVIACSLQFPVLSRPPADRFRPSVPVEIAAPPSDHDLMLAVRDGEIDSLGELFERHQGPLFGFLVKLTGDRTAAEDIVQTVFQRMLKYRHTYRDDGSFTAWMYHLARRCAADHFRKAASLPAPVDPADLADRADDRPAADENAARGDDRDLLRRALARLDATDREVLLLSRFQEMSFAEVAGVLECSVGAARVRAHRALRELRVHFLRLQSQALL